MRGALLAGTALAAPLAIATLLTASPSFAACIPAAPVDNTTVTCSGTTTDQNPPNGYGTGVENNLTINVQSGASVNGTDDGFLLGNGNTINNSGTINAGLNGINTFAGGAVTVNNTGTIFGGGTAIVGDAVTLTNSGTISSGADAIFSTTVANVANSGSIAGVDRGINATTVNIINSGTISASSLFGAAVSATDGAISNTGSLTGPFRGVSFTGTGVVGNQGTISATGVGGLGIEMTNGTIINSGTVSANAATGTAIGTAAAGTVSVTNTGTISANGPNGTGVFANIDATLNLNNSGIISATGPGGNAVQSNGGAVVSVTNSGMIIGNTALSSLGGPPGWTIVNSGSIIGTGGTAIDLSASGGDSLTFLPGSRILGQILLGPASSINIRVGSDVASLLTFGTPGGAFGLAGSTVSVSSGQPFVVSGNQVATLEPTAFGLIDRTLTDFTGNISSLIGSRFRGVRLTGCERSKRVRADDEQHGRCGECRLRQHSRAERLCRRQQGPGHHPESNDG